MNASLALLAITAVAGLFVMALVGFNSEITGQGINIAKIPPETLKKLAAEVDKGKSQPSPPPAETKYVCNCPDYGDSILTTKDTFLAGLSKWDCELIKEITKLRTELKKPNPSLDKWNKFCETYFK